MECNILETEGARNQNFMVYSEQKQLSYLSKEDRYLS